MVEDSLRQLPSVDSLLSHDGASVLVAEYGRALTLAVIRESLEAARARIRAGEAVPEPNALIASTHERLNLIAAPTLQPVINATGVIIHTNLGRAPLSRAAIGAMEAAARGYSTLEYDLADGARGSRAAHAESLLTRLTGAEAALVVNNNAAAVLLALSALAAGRGKGVVISRGQLVEIGGGFRVPDVLKQSGAKLVEVGTTNRTHLRDYENAIDEKTALILRAHHSNFKIVGFTTEPPLAELARLGAKHELPVVDDLGSGALIDTAQFGLAHEPTAQESLRDGAALVCFSGDKLLGGPQAGIVVGRKAQVDKLAKHPLARAVRADKLCLAALSATLLHYLKDEVTHEIPVWRMIAAPQAEIKKRAGRWVESWRSQGAEAEVIAGESTVGGGSLPGETLPTSLAALRLARPDDFAARLRAASPPIVARIVEDRLAFDPRTVLEEEDAALMAAVSVLVEGRKTDGSARG
ncbi:MAG: L-seryl-tRNA(Sec) selenium transferase [Chloroflexi bacterium]|nr:L-seryl-tRNA(Sec) selenium transferase [Chloroflexota bacterium]